MNASITQGTGLVKLMRQPHRLFRLVRKYIPMRAWIAAHRETIHIHGRSEIKVVIVLVIKVVLGVVSHLSIDDSTGGYVITDKDVEGQLTEMGWRAIDRVGQLALDSSTYLWDITGHIATPTPAHELLSDLEYDASYLFSVVSAALAGLKNHPTPLQAVWGLKLLLEEMKGQCESDEIVAASSAADGGEGESATPETPQPAERSTPTLDQYHWVCDVVDAVNVTAALLAPFCLDAGNPGFKGRDDGEVTDEGWRCLSAVTRAIDDVMAAEKRVDGCILAVPTCLIPLQWTLHSLDEARRNPTPDLSPAENAAEILDFAFDQVLGLAQHVRQYADGMKAAAS